MMERDKDGFIVSKLPETAVFLKGLERLVIPFEGGFPEYTPDTYNGVLSFFKKTGENPDIDNLNNSEWNDLNCGFKIIEVKGICRIGYKAEDEVLAGKIAKIMEKFRPAEEYERNLNELTVLDVCFSSGKNQVHVELPYCTINQICER